MPHFAAQGAGATGGPGILGPELALLPSGLVFSPSDTVLQGIRAAPGAPSRAEILVCTPRPSAWGSHAPSHHTAVPPPPPSPLTRASLRRALICCVLSLGPCPLGSGTEAPRAGHPGHQAEARAGPGFWGPHKARSEGRSVPAVRECCRSVKSPPLTHWLPELFQKARVFRLLKPRHWNRVLRARREPGRKAGGPLETPVRDSRSTGAGWECCRGWRPGPEEETCSNLAELEGAIWGVRPGMGHLGTPEVREGKRQLQEGVLSGCDPCVCARTRAHTCVNCVYVCVVVGGSPGAAGRGRIRPVRHWFLVLQVTYVSAQTVGSVTPVL